LGEPCKAARCGQIDRFRHSETLQPNERRCDPDDSTCANRRFAQPCRAPVRHLESFGLRCVYTGEIRTGQDAVCKSPSPKGGRIFVARSDGAPEIVQV
jgi:hypothetical protein